MAIKIIKKGNKTFKTLCSKCDCLFSYQLNDLCSGTFVCCPECNCNIQHSDRIKEEKYEEIECHTNDAGTIKIY